MSRHSRIGSIAVAISLTSLVSLSACSDDDSKTGSAAGAAGSDESAGADSGGASAAGSLGEGGFTSAGEGATDAGGPSVGPGTISAADGGTITAEGFVLDIPPGALEEDTVITVEVSDGAGAPGEESIVASVYDLGPDGTTFLKPVKLSFEFDADKLGDKQPVVSYLEGDEWVALSDSKVDGSTVHATTTHFTEYTVVGMEAAQCTALAKEACKSCCKSVYPGNEPLTLAIEYCGCKTDSPCETLCADNVCDGAAPTTECQMCLKMYGDANPQTQCITDSQIACTESATCQAYVACSVSCPMQ